MYNAVYENLIDVFFTSVIAYAIMLERPSWVALPRKSVFPLLLLLFGFPPPFTGDVPVASVFGLTCHRGIKFPKALGFDEVKNLVI